MRISGIFFEKKINSFCQKFYNSIFLRHKIFLTVLNGRRKPDSEIYKRENQSNP